MPFLKKSDSPVINAGYASGPTRLISLMLQLARLVLACFIKPMGEYFVVRFVSHYVLCYRDDER